MSKTPTLRRHLIESAVISLVLTALSYIVALAAGWIHELDWLEVSAVFTSYACTYLCVKQRRINYVIGVITTGLYCLLFWKAGLISSMLLQIYLIPTLVYGWFRWRKDSDPRPVLYAYRSPRWIPVYLGVTAAIYVGAVAMSSALGGSFALLDGFILSGTILAQFLMDNKKIENWMVWFLVDAVAIYEYFASGLPLAGFQFVFFLANTIYGWQQWRASMKLSIETPAQQAIV